MNQQDQIDDDAVSDSPAVVVRAPDQIWLCCGDMYDMRGCDVEFDDIKRSFEVSWCEDQIDESDVKYIRADLFARAEAETSAALEVIAAKDAEIAALKIHMMGATNSKESDALLASQEGA